MTEQQPRRNKVIAYIDGYNLYHALKEANWQRFYWLDISALCQSLLRHDQELVLAKYFTALVKGPADKQARQAAFCDALKHTKGIRVVYGRFKYNDVECRNCHCIESVPTEKRSDVSLAVEMLSDAHNNQFDTALLVSGDTDFCPAVEAVLKTYPGKRVVVCFPPNRQNNELRQVASAHLVIGRAKFAQSQFPDTIIKAAGDTITRPERWSNAYQDRMEQEAERRKKLKGGLD